MPQSPDERPKRTQRVVRGASILPFMPRGVFDDAATKVMGQAFDAACKIAVPGFLTRARLGTYQDATALAQLTGEPADIARRTAVPHAFRPEHEPGARNHR
jgi:hypothetical protein